jgi:hypothetical protein
MDRLLKQMINYAPDAILISDRAGVNPRAAVIEGARAILPVILMLNQWK